jgi:hypothetical protein
MRTRDFNPFRSNVRYTLVLVLAGCAVEVAPPDDPVAYSEHGLTQRIAFETLVDPNGIGNAGQTLTRIVITDARRYAALFGHAPPATVDFRNGDAVAFYGAGLKPTGGYEASIASIVRDGKQLQITTQLVSPGTGCVVTQAVSKPFALVKFRRPVRIKWLRFTHRDAVRDCEQDPCAGVRCPAGSFCEAVEDRAACMPSGASCGGIAGFLCPGSGRCEDDPTDSCDPRTGGADFGGVCVCPSQNSCLPGFFWDNDPEVCTCVLQPDVNPCLVTLCPPGTICAAPQGLPLCVAN